MKYCNSCQSNDCICLEVEKFFEDVKDIPRNDNFFDIDKFFNYEDLNGDKKKIPRFNQ